MQNVGTPISRDLANQEISLHAELAEDRKAKYAQVFAGITGPLSVQDKKRVNFNNNAFNAFIFSKDVILRFFNVQDLGPDSGKAEDLMIVLGARIDGGNAGNPTVIVVGVNQVAGTTDKYESLDISDPASEYPPFTAIASVPPPGLGGSDNKFIFTLR